MNAKRKIGRPAVGRKRGETFTTKLSKEEKEKIAKILSVEGKKKIDVFLGIFKIN